MQHTTAVRTTTRALEFEAYCEHCSWVERVATRGEAVSVRERALDLAQEHYETATQERQEALWAEVDASYDAGTYTPSGDPAAHARSKYAS